MTREIFGLDMNVWQSLKQQLPRVAKNTNAHFNGVIDVELADPVILKCYDDMVMLDLGGEYVSFRNNSFQSIQIK